METSDDPKTQPTPRASGPVPLTVVWIVLAMLAIALIVRGAMMVHAARQVEREVYPRNWPTTGPYSAEELQSARALVAEHLALVEGSVIPPSTQQVESAAASQRLMEQGRRETWQRIREVRLASAAQQRLHGWIVFSLGTALSGVFAILAHMTGAQGKA